MAKAEKGGPILAGEGVTAIMKEAARPTDVSARENSAASFCSGFVKRFKESKTHRFVKPVHAGTVEYGKNIPETELQISVGISR